MTIFLEGDRTGSVVDGIIPSHFVGERGWLQVAIRLGMRIATHSLMDGIGLRLLRTLRTSRDQRANSCWDKSRPEGRTRE